jgi:endoglucanase
MPLHRFKARLSWFLAAILLTAIAGNLFGALISQAALSPQIVLNQVGYGSDWQKQAFLINAINRESTPIEVIDRATNRSVLTVSARQGTPPEQLQVIDFSDLTAPGEYILQAEKLQSVPFQVGEDSYRDPLVKLLRSYYLQRCGIAIADPVTGIRHAPCHLKDGAIAHRDLTHLQGKRIAATGGWHDAGDYGKYVATTTVTIGQLLSLYEQFPDRFPDGQLQIPESGNGIPDLLDEMQVGLDWLLTMQRSDGAVYRKLSGRQWPIGKAPDEDAQPRYVYGISTPETAKLAAVMAMAGRVYQPIVPERAASYRAAASKAWRFLQKHPQMQVDWVEGDDRGSGKYLYSEIDNEESLKTDADDRLWAAAELSIASSQPQIDLKILPSPRLRHPSPTSPCPLLQGEGNGSFFCRRGDGGEGQPSYLSEQDLSDRLQSMDYTLFEWKDPSSLGMLDYLLQPENCGSQELKDNIQAKLLARADRILQKVKQSTYHLANDRFIWGSNKMTLQEGITLAYAYKITSDRQYLDAARDQLHFIFGRNPFHQTFVTGVGTNPVQNVNHLFARAKKIRIPGLLVGGPNNGAQDGIAPKDRGVLSYIDSEQSYATNEYAVDYNAALISLIGLVANTN